MQVRLLQAQQWAFCAASAWRCGSLKAVAELAARRLASLPTPLHGARVSGYQEPAGVFGAKSTKAQRTCTHQKCSCVYYMGIKWGGCAVVARLMLQRRGRLAPARLLLLHLQSSLRTKPGKLNISSSQ